MDDGHDRAFKTYRMWSLAAAVAALALSPGCGDHERGVAGAETSRPPNVVLILADDLGYNDISLHGNPLLSTPNIDSLARDGVRFTAGYVSNAVCAPSRAGLLTGRYQQRFGFEFNPTSVRFARAMGGDADGVRDGAFREDQVDKVPAPELMGMRPEEITLAELLKARGYATAQIGKWHLGAHPDLRPDAQGFDSHVGFYAGASMFAERDDPEVVDARLAWSRIDNFVWEVLPYSLVRDGQPSDERPYQTTLWGDEAVSFVLQNRDKPFFLYLAFNAPHNPIQAPKAIYDELEGIDDHTARVYYAMIVAMDRQIGRLLGTLDELGLTEDTIVIFSSDNGGADYVGMTDLNLPWRGWKASFWEGGVRVPFLIRWPAKLPAGIEFDRPVSLLDVFPTVAAAAGAQLPGDRVIDGVDLVPYILRATDGDPHETLYWRCGHYRAVRHGDWKLELSDRPERVWLYDLVEDPGEARNLAGANPEQVAQLRALFESRAEEFIEPVWPSLFEVPVYASAPVGRQDPDDPDYVVWPN
jgi:arylsulfatase A-like enzyme